MPIRPKIEDWSQEESGDEIVAVEGEGEEDPEDDPDLAALSDDVPPGDDQPGNDYEEPDPSDG